MQFNVIQLGNSYAISVKGEAIRQKLMHRLNLDVISKLNLMPKIIWTVIGYLQS